ncbi:MAG: peptidylprolyl isomerase [Rhodospirillaceae bacterium]
MFRSPFGIKSLGFCVFLLLSGLDWIGTSGAGQTRIAAVVNKDIITAHEVEQRIQLVLISTGLRPDKVRIIRIGRRVLDTLIDEKLKFSEANKLSIRVSDSEFKTAVKTLEKNNRLKDGSLRSFLESKNIAWDTITAQIKSQIIWSKLVRRLLIPKVRVSEDEVSERLQSFLEKKQKTEYRISEIFLALNDSVEPSELRANGLRLIEDLKLGTDFGKLSREFSDSPSASENGDLGWLRLESLPEILKPEIPKMKPGDLSGPLKSIDGYYIFKVNEIRGRTPEPEADTKVSLKRLLLDDALPPTKNNFPRLVAQLESITRSTLGCSNFDKAALSAGFNIPPKETKFKLGDLDQKIREAIRKLPIGVPSDPTRIGSKIGIFMVCSREETSSNVQKEQLRQQLRREKLDVIVRRYIRDLRASALIDIRF